MTFHPCKRQHLWFLSIFTLQLTVNIGLLKKGGGIESKFLVKAVILICLSQITSALVCD